MGSGDLNMKKSWHPQRSGNLAATAKAESEAIAERKKMQLRLHEIEQERKNEDIQKALEAQGGKRKLDRVEWMYAGPTDGQIGDAAESEAYLLGKRRIDKLLQDNEIKKLSKRPDLEQASMAPIVANARDLATKIREDPLLAIKRQEQQAYEAAMNDPIKRRQLLASLEIDDSQHKSKRKEERHHRHHHHRSHRRRDDDRDGDRHSRRRSSDSRDRSHTPKRYDSDGEDRRRRRRDSPDRRRKDSPERRRHRSASEDERDSRSKRDEGRTRHHHDRRSRDLSGSRSPGPRKRRDDSRERDDRPRRRDQDDRNDYRGESKNEDRFSDRNDRSFRPRKEYREENRSRPSGGPRPPFTNNDSDSKEAAEKERARKLAAMQEAARDLDKDRKERLAAIEEADRKAKEEDDRVRQRNKKYGGEAMFTNALHSRAAEIKISERMERAG